MRVVVVFVASVALAGCAVDRAEATRTTREAVIGGAPDTAHPGVVSIATSLDATTAGELCTGTIIAPRVVLTAGHCTIGQDASSLIVGVGANAQYPASTLAIAAVVTYPGFSGTAEDIAAGLDLGVILLAQDAGLAAVPLSTTSPEVGSTLAVVGFGLSDAADADSRGMRRSAQVGVSAACSALVAFGDAASNACHGDSGGPLLARAADGTESLVGVVSFGDDLHCAEPSYAVRVDRYAAWIESVVAGSSDGGDCAACPARPSDCAAIEVDAGADAGIDGAVSGDAGEPAPVAEGPSPSGSGCACAGAEPRSTSTAFVIAALGVALALRRRRLLSRPRVDGEPG